MTTEPEPVLTAIDQAFAAPRRRSITSRPIPASVREIADDTFIDDSAIEDGSTWRQVGWIEAFFAVQLLWGAMLFVPGAQPFRQYVRALPYITSLAMLVWYLVRHRVTSMPPGGALLLGASLLLVANLLHPTSQLSSGLAQCVFQICIAAPLFWAHATVRSTRHVQRILVLIFVMSFVSALLGVLQVYFPDRFMPPEFNSLGSRLNRYYIDGLTYVGANGADIIRPPGLTDQPGGAAVAGGLTAIIGLGLLLQRRHPLQVITILSAIGIGLAAVYFTQVRSVLLAALGAGSLLGLAAFRQGRIVGASSILLVGASLMVGSFLWATSIGGDSVNDRFLNLTDTGLVQAYQDNRGGFLSYTVDELLDKYPLGAGVGRWGMMSTYFGDPSESAATPIYVEIQLTGWLLDGGVPMWLLYGGAIALALLATLRATSSDDDAVSGSAIIVLAVQAFIAVMVLVSPVFNTQLGILFWASGGLLYRAATRNSGWSPTR